MFLQQPSDGVTIWQSKWLSLTCCCFADVSEDVMLCWGVLVRWMEWVEKSHHRAASCAWIWNIPIAHAVEFPSSIHVGERYDVLVKKLWVCFITDVLESILDPLGKQYFQSVTDKTICFLSQQNGLYWMLMIISVSCCLVACFSQSLTPTQWALYVQVETPLQSR